MDFTPTLHYLQKELVPWKVEAKVYSSADLEKAIKDGSIDFFYASAGFFYRMRSEEHTSELQSQR